MERQRERQRERDGGGIEGERERETERGKSKRLTKREREMGEGGSAVGVLTPTLPPNISSELACYCEGCNAASPAFSPSHPIPSHPIPSQPPARSHLLCGDAECERVIDGLS